MADHYIDQDRSVHCEGVDGGDYMLCGHAPEGEYDNGHMTETDAPVDCLRCLRIIKFTRALKLGELAVPLSQIR